MSLNQLCVILARACAAAVSAGYTVTWYPDEGVLARDIAANRNSRGLSVVLCDDPQQARERSRSHSARMMFVPHPPCTSASHEKNGLFFLCHVVSLQVAEQLFAAAHSSASLPPLPHVYEVITSEVQAMASVSRLFAGSVEFIVRHPSTASSSSR
jgi:hypothetical protein